MKNSKLFDLGRSYLFSMAFIVFVHSVQASEFIAGCDGFTGDVDALRSAIEMANDESVNPGLDTIQLGSACIYSITGANNYWYGPNGLPAISSEISIQGNGATLARQGSSGNFRIFYVSGGLSGLPSGLLTITNATISGGVAKGGNGGGGGGAGMGGAIFNQGGLLLVGVTLTQNEASGGEATGSAGGGGIGQDALSNGNGGGFGGVFPGGGGGAGGSGSTTSGGGGGGGFSSTSNGSNAGGPSAGNGGGTSGLGGNGGGGVRLPGIGGDGGGGGGGNAQGSNPGGSGGNFGFGGRGDGSTGGGWGGGGGVGGGGGRSAVNGQGGGGGGFGAGGGLPNGSGGFGGGGAAPGFGAGNGGAGMGGAIFNHNGSIEIVNTTIAFNTARGGDATPPGKGLGGGIFNLNGSVTLTNTTIAANRVITPGGAGSGGGIYNVGYLQSTAGGLSSIASIVLQNTILTGSTDDGGPVTDMETVQPNTLRNGAVNIGTAPVYVNSHDIITMPGSITGALSIAPLLGPLQNNGGLTSTMALLPGSPAIDSGDPCASGLPQFDQRGPNFPRVWNSVPDIGAYEFGSPFDLIFADGFEANESCP
ncbi:MAG: hypothetical protein EYC71_10645 [Gammaproteobacteria bacterium]|nr:MAG: hypothetical protein EYC71_10645 [Gammaproteobacteria bacterium]